MATGPAPSLPGEMSALSGFGVCPDKDRAVAIRLIQIADALKAPYAPVQAAWRNLQGAGSNDRVARVFASVADYKASLSAYMVEIGNLTNNAPDRLISIFCGSRDPAACPLTPDDLRKVAHYRSFNAALWTPHSGPTDRRTLRKAAWMP